MCEALLGGLLLSSCAAANRTPTTTTASDSYVLADDFELTRLSPGVWRHVSYKDLPGVGRFPSNGLLIEGDGGVLLVDTPWTPEQTDRLRAFVHVTLGAEVTDLIVTHAHDDRMGGVSRLPPSARIHALPLTVERAAKEGVELQATPLAANAPSALVGRTVETFFPGPGHAPDNLLVYLPAEKLLFGGCFVKSQSSTSLGNLADADVGAWGASLNRAAKRFPDAGVVVPGHGAPGGVELLAHTAQLVDAGR